MDLYILLVFLIFYLTLYFLIFIHELGHLINAKVNGVLCRKFTIGVGPRLFSFYLGETEYQFHLLPMAGGVEMAGEDGSDFDDAQGKRVLVVLNKAGKVTKLYINPSTTLKDVKQVEGEIINFSLRESMRLRIETKDGQIKTFQLTDNAHIYEDENNIQMAPVNRRFWSKTPMQKIAIILGGPFFNIIAAMITFMLIGVFIGTPGQSLTVGKVHTNSISARAGLQTGDVITELNGVQLHSKKEYEETLKTIPAPMPYKLVVQRGENTLSLYIQHVNQENSVSPSLGFETVRAYGVLEGLHFGIKTTGTLIVSIILGVKALFLLDFSNLTLGGPLSIFQQNNQVTTTSPYESVLLFIAMMSLNLGILNLFPIPLLDGGRLVNVFIEKITHRKMSRKSETIMALIGITILVLFLVLITFSDIQKFLNR